jgi:hypothetical protein
MPETIPLEEVVLKCAFCGSSITAKEVNNDIERYYSWHHMSFIRFPEAGVSEKMRDKLQTMKFSCEICHEKDQETTRH